MDKPRGLSGKCLSSSLFRCKICICADWTKEKSRESLKEMNIYVMIWWCRLAENVAQV
jgi:hypothetical protein